MFFKKQQQITHVRDKSQLANAKSLITSKFGSAFFVDFFDA